MEKSPNIFKTLQPAVRKVFLIFSNFLWTTMCPPAPGARASKYHLPDVEFVVIIVKKKKWKDFGDPNNCVFIIV